MHKNIENMRSKPVEDDVVFEKGEIIVLSLATALLSLSLVV